MGGQKVCFGLSFLDWQSQNCPEGDGSLFLSSTELTTMCQVLFIQAVVNRTDIALDFKGFTVKLRKTENKELNE